MPKRHKKKAALPPGSVIYVGVEKKHSVSLSLTQYRSGTVSETVLPTEIDFDAHFSANRSQKWLNIDGVHDTEQIKNLGQFFSLHPLVLEDIVNTNQRPKLEEYDDCIFIVARMLHFSKEEAHEKKIISENVSFILQKNLLLSFQEYPGDVFDPIRTRLKDPNGRLQNRKTDYLLYTLIDAIVDNYLIILDHIGNQIDQLEEKIELDTSGEIAIKIHEIKRQLISLGKTTRSVREVVSKLERRQTNLIEKSTHYYIQDVYDHVIHVSETIESYREITNDLLENYHTITSNRANEIMKILTVFASIFLPLTFLAGIYGMNFENMPELRFQYGYHILLLILLSIGIGMVIFFRKKKWF